MSLQSTPVDILPASSSSAKLPLRPEIEGKQDIKGLTLSALEEWLATQNADAYRSRQIFQWLYHHAVEDFAQMTTLSQPLRELLDRHFHLGKLPIAARQTSADNSCKVRFQLQDGKSIEAVLMPNRRHYTACISTQVGCAMGCTFCLTATMGLKRQLTAGEIVAQAVELLRLTEADKRITNLVFMGMGEPLHNYDNLICALEILQANDGMRFAARRITISTSGLVPAIRRFAKEKLRINLAVSLNATTDTIRSRLMPINRRWNIVELLNACRLAPQRGRDQLTFEYILIKGITDHLEDAHRLVKLLHGLPCKVNLIMYNTFPQSPYQAPSMKHMRSFQRILLDKGLIAPLRLSKGQDIMAACGQLATAS